MEILIYIAASLTAMSVAGCVWIYCHARANALPHPIAIALLNAFVPVVLWPKYLRLPKKGWLCALVAMVLLGYVAHQFLCLPLLVRFIALSVTSPIFLLIGWYALTAICSSFAVLAIWGHGMCDRD